MTPSEPFDPTPGSQDDVSLPVLGPDDVEEHLHSDLEQVIPSKGEHVMAVVGLGGSAGSIAALGAFFDQTPPDTDLCYVVVLHLAPTHHSMLPELLQRHSDMPVRAARHGETLKANHVYVIPSGKHLTTAGGHLRVTDLQPQHGKRVAVDLFFRSLADAHGPRATAIVLSGADGDGAEGLKRIKERGGLTIAQDPGEAEHPSMPRSAIATGMVDWVLPVGEMPRRITGYRARESALKLPPEDVEPSISDAEGVVARREIHLREILDLVKARTGREFSYYKRGTIVRRIARRMQVSGLVEMADYLTLLRTQPGEATALMAELLISVTNFFRDRGSFRAVQAQIARLFEDKGAEHQVRVWVPACATGEEAYSMAMLLLEHARKLDTPPSLQVFACDLDDDAIRFARAGLFPESIAADVSEERLQRFFTKAPDGWLVRRELRETVLFASHDLIKDAPFSRIDLVSCRNLLIYLNADAQQRCFEIFNFALKPGGLLFLGSSETLPDGSSLFSVLDSRHRLYVQRPPQRRAASGPNERLDGALQRVLHHHETLKATATATAMPRGQFGATEPSIIPLPETLPATLAPAEVIHFRLLAQWGPPSVLVDGAHDIVHLSGDANSYLQIPGGEPTRNLLRLVVSPLRLALQSAMLAAEEQGRTVEIHDQALEVSGKTCVIDLRVAPAGDIAPGHFLVVFASTRDGPAETERLQPAIHVDAAVMIRQLENQLLKASERLKTVVEQHDVATEELKAGNIELQAMNEELRSAGEELESGREEVQSVNEELTTLNAEFRQQLEEVARANSDMQNLMSATQIATLFLDRKMQVMRYTPSAAPLFNLIPSDRGRPVSDLKRRLEYPQLAGDIEQVLRTLVPVERETRDGARWLLARTLPYRTLDDHIAGVVITFMDLTDRKNFEGALRASEDRLRRLADAVPQLIWTNNRQGKAIYFNRRWYEYSGCSVEESVGPGWQAIVHPADRDRAVALWQASLERTETFECEYRLRRADGVYRWFIGRNVPTEDLDGQGDGWFGTATDVDDLKSVEVSLRSSEEQLRRAIEDAPIPVIMQADDGQVLQISKAWSDLTGFQPDDLPTFESWLDQAHGPGADEVRDRIHELFKGEVSVLNAELDVATRSGAVRRWIFSASAPGALRDGRRFIVGMVTDVTEYRQAQEQLRESEDRLRLIVDNARDYAIFSLDLDRRITSWNTGAEAILGYAHDEALALTGDVIFTDEDRAAGAPELEASTALRDDRAADERWHVRKDGSRFWGSGVMMAMRDGPGTALGLVKIFRDQTAELHSKEAMEQSQRQLHAALHDTEIARDQAQAADKTKDRFLAVLSHELRAPLSPVLLAAQVLARNKTLPAALLPMTGMIERNVRLQAHLIDDLLDVSRITHGKMELTLDRLDLHATVLRAVEVAHPDLEGKRQELALGLEADCFIVWGDAKRLQQVFWNLLKNASKFTPEGGRVCVRSRNEGEQVVVEVSDTGVGFESGDAGRIFAVFEQASRHVTAKYGGLGLGLAIAEASVRAHQGDIRADSAGPGKGATFTVCLPLLTNEVRRP